MRAAVKSEDFRLTANLPVEMTLLCCEGRDFAFDRKGSKAVQAERCGFLLLASNGIDSVKTQWTQIDVGAFLDRFVCCELRTSLPTHKRKPLPETTCHACATKWIGKWKHSLAYIRYERMRGGAIST